MRSPEVALQRLDDRRHGGVVFAASRPTLRHAGVPSAGAATGLAGARVLGRCRGLSQRRQRCLEDPLGDADHVVGSVIGDRVAE